MPRRFGYVELGAAEDRARAEGTLTERKRIIAVLLNRADACKAHRGRTIDDEEKSELYGAERVLRLIAAELEREP